MLGKSVTIAFALIFFGCPAGLLAQNDVLTQVSTIDALLNGVYDGKTTLQQLATHGDFGIGTFQALDGEMLMIDGRIYQVDSTGAVNQPAMGITTPFAATTFFDADRTHGIEAGTTYDVFQKKMDTRLPTPNIFYAVKITGVFRTVKTRSVPRQTRPYPPLKEVAKTQPVFNFQNVAGTMVGFRCPPYVTGINVPGYHLHFITQDRQSGGHVLEFTIVDGVVQVDDTAEFHMILPVDPGFFQTDLKKDNEAALKAVER